MWSLGVPDILLAVETEDDTIVRDEICGVVEEIPAIWSRLLFNDCPWNQAEVLLSCDGLVSGEIPR